MSLPKARAKRMHSGEGYAARMAAAREALRAQGPTVRLSEEQAAAEAAALGAAITSYGTQIYVTDRASGALLGSGLTPEAALQAARIKLNKGKDRTMTKAQAQAKTQVKAQAQKTAAKAPAPAAKAAVKTDLRHPLRKAGAQKGGPKAHAPAPKPVTPAPAAAPPPPAASGPRRPAGATTETYQKWLAKRAQYRANAKATPVQAKIAKKLRLAAAFMRRSIAATKGWPETVINALNLAAAGADGAVAALDALPADFKPEPTRKRGVSIQPGMTVRVKERCRSELPKFGASLLEVVGREGRTLEVLFDKKTAFIQEDRVEVVA